MTATTLPKHISAYYDALSGLEQRGAEHEGAVRVAFQNLLDHTGRPKGLVVVAEQTLRIGRKRIRVDGEVRDPFNIRFGIWEAKDSADDLEAEIRAKVDVGYPTRNIIFEDSRRAVLFQHGVRRGEYDLRKSADLERLLADFFAFTEPQIAEFHAAVDEFADRIPQLAQGLKEIIEKEKKANKRFAQALEDFLALCRASLNPDTSMEEVEDMLRQHLLTERVFRSVFRNDEFVRRNPIARELELVTDALTSRSFSRTEFLKRLDHFYHAIEATAATIESYSEKQQFLHTVYERFFQNFSTDTADTHGIVYTPEPIVKWMIASVEAVLEREFGKSLSDAGVHILDPCVGTGTFMLELMEHIRPSALPHKYREELHCNEVLLLPYYIAAQNIEHEFLERTETYEPFPGICFADTLEMGRAQLGFFTPENAERVQRQERAPIQVIIGNPPYNVGQQNENDNNRNRKHPEVDARIKATYVKGSRASLNAQLYDMYVRFFRWATDRLHDRDGVICYVSNNGFLSGIAFDGFRDDLVKEFTHIYHFDLKGNARTSGDRRRREGGNIFRNQIRTSVGITILVRNRTRDDRGISYHVVGDYWSAATKQAYLESFSNYAEVPWRQIHSDGRGNWLTTDVKEDVSCLVAIGSRQSKAAVVGASDTIFRTYSGGVKTNRDAWVFDFQRDPLLERINAFAAAYNEEVRRWSVAPDSTNLDDFVRSDPRELKWSSGLKEHLRRGTIVHVDPSKIRWSLYRPFVRQRLYFDGVLIDRRLLQHLFFPNELSGNRAIVVSDVGHRAAFGTIAVAQVPELHLLAASDSTQCFPFYLYNEDGSEQRENITDWALDQYKRRYGADVTKWNIFYYIYGVLHSPQYRERFAGTLQRDLPRIPYVSSHAFYAFVEAGKRLVDLHVDYEDPAVVKPYPLRHIERSRGFTWRVERMKLSPDRTKLIVNDTLTLAEIPPEAFEYRVGIRSALDWVIDQFRVKTDVRSGIESDPNDPEDPEYIVRLVKQVVAVSVETMQIVNGLPPLEIIP
jgi:predicted helicase